VGLGGSWELVAAASSIRRSAYDEDGGFRRDERGPCVRVWCEAFRGSFIMTFDSRPDGQRRRGRKEMEVQTVKTGTRPDRKKTQRGQ